MVIINSPIFYGKHHFFKNIAYLLLNLSIINIYKRAVGFSYNSLQQDRAKNIINKAIITRLKAVVRTRITDVENKFRISYIKVLLS